ncbi:MAG: hypothetical protein KC983_05035 [Phycisphaerales bacterium]|nr:hypothetical protein [Phycisphaerales bacterium]
MPTPNLLCPECPQCGHDRTGVEPGRRCAECGFEIPAGSVSIRGRASGYRDLAQLIPILAVPLSISLFLGIICFFPQLLFVPSQMLFGRTPSRWFTNGLVVLIIAVVLWRALHVRLWQRRHVFFAQPLGYSVTLGHGEPMVSFWPNRGIVTLHTLRRGIFSRQHSDQPRKWQLALATPIGEQELKHHLTLNFCATDTEAHAMRAAIEKLCLEGQGRDPEAILREFYE